MLDEPIWQSEAKQWLLLDGALVGHVVRYARGQVDNGIDVINLFWNSPWKDLDDIGPVIVEFHPELFNWAQQQAGYRYGLAFESDAPLITLYEHWQCIIRYPQPQGGDFLLRLYDPVIWDYFFLASAKPIQTQLFGPMHTVHTFGALEQRWQHYLKPVDDGEMSVEPIRQMKVSDEQWQALTEASRHYQAIRVMEHAEKYFPQLLSAPDAKSNHQWVMEELRRLSKIGASDDRSALLYINILGRMGNIWDEQNPNHQEFTQLLLSHEQLPTARIEQVEKLSADYHQSNKSGTDI
ncbi:DUF4123 domain-containing protein [Celerinatantimonas diazotrophica]|uniref:Uncharacterized protein DUF4123 n=1 Tax=Celerinatantimonas diazotrophica TaxID=412034 RepID=A0A4V2PRT1_9GAMM|nr:DUF4123 domain-containing protein [Celerinatantimonas diazotrophica]TCK60081.1 uncharacterized protein DUF4123 [Celerinatantimonas diazotrophica]CAG9295105.1 hypothetical protein CEDIAZO_00217 [Celerinatantimonas diazotrophica]